MRATTDYHNELVRPRVADLRDNLHILGILSPFSAQQVKRDVRLLL